MIYRYLGEYDRFKCIADKCPATCCSGWAVEIDEESLHIYKEKAEKEKDGKLSQMIDWEESCFCQKGNGDCAFLREDKLCQMYIDYGEGFFCQTCDQYPRHMEEFPNVREYSLSVSCPVAAKMLLEAEKPLAIQTEQDEETEDIYEDFNEPLYELLQKCRDEALEILLDRNVSLPIRSKKILEKMKMVQDALDGFESDDAPILREANTRDGFELLFELEPLQPEFRQFLKKAKKVLFTDDSDIYREAFERMHPKWDIWCEQLIRYFLFTYMCGSVYDDYVFAMTAQAVYNTEMIKQLWLAEWIISGAMDAQMELTEEIVIKVVYSYSRELEHSNENMILLESLLDEFYAND